MSALRCSWLLVFDSGWLPGCSFNNLLLLHQAVLACATHVLFCCWRAVAVICHVLLPLPLLLLQVEGPVPAACARPNQQPAASGGHAEGDGVCSALHQGASACVCVFVRSRLRGCFLVDF